MGTGEGESVVQTLAEMRLGWVALFCLGLLLARVLLKPPRLLGFGRPADWRLAIADVVEAILVAVAIVAFIIRPMIAQAYFIPSGSMLETLAINERIIVNKMTYRLYQPRFGDIVVFTVEQERPTGGLAGNTAVVSDPSRPYNGSLMGELFGYPSTAPFVHKQFIKRCIGVPGDEVRIVGGKVYRNGKPLREPYLRNHPEEGPPMDPSETWPDELRDGTKPWVIRKPDGYWARVPKDCFFVLGDNRTQSSDSRSWGFVHRSRIVGKAWFSFWPPDRARFLNGDPLKPAQRGSPTRFWALSLLTIAGLSAMWLVPKRLRGKNSVARAYHYSEEK